MGLDRLQGDVERVAQDADARARICRAATSLRIEVLGDERQGMVLQLGPDELRVLEVGAPADGTIAVPAELLDDLLELHVPAELLEGRITGEGRLRPALMVLPVLRAAARAVPA